MTPPPARRSDPTRAAILAAGRKHFSERGFEAATVRAIAAEAHTDPSLVIRYFGSKRGLYDATTEVELHLPDFSAVPRSRLGDAVMAEFLNHWEGAAGQPLRVLLTAAATDPAAAAAMRDIFSRQVRPAVSAAARDHPDQRVTLVATTVIGLATSRYLLRLPGVADLTRDELTSLYAPVLQRQLTSPLGR